MIRNASGARRQGLVVGLVLLLVLGTLAFNLWWILSDVGVVAEDVVEVGASPGTTPRLSRRQVGPAAEGAPLEDEARDEARDTAEGPGDPGLRHVALDLYCTDCPSEVRCQGSHLGEACTGELPHLQCRCLPGAVQVTGHTTDALFDWSVEHEILGGLPPEVEAWTIRREGERGSLRARWAGEGSCAAWLELDGGVAAGPEWCDEDGEVRFEEVRPGALVLVMGPQGSWKEGRDPALMARAQVRLGDGEFVDLGLLYPGDGEEPANP